MRTANFTEFRRNMSHYLDSVAEHSDRVIIPRSKGKAVIVMSLSEYNAIEKKLAANSDKNHLNGNGELER